MKKVLFLAILGFILISCNDREQDPMYYNVFSSIATVENPDSVASFKFKLDNNDVMWVTKSDFPTYKPQTGQRIIATYSILSVNDNATTYNHQVYLRDVYKVLTKGIFNVTAATQDSIGNDQVNISQMWIGSDYLNVEFSYFGYDKTHYINLVSDSSKTYTDGKIHLEFRHNANSDYPQFFRQGIVSFNLTSLQQFATGDSVNLVIHTREYTNPIDQTYDLTYKFGNAAVKVKEMTVQAPPMNARANNR